MMMKTKALSEEQYWDHKFKDIQLPRIVHFGQYNYRRFHQLFQKSLPAGANFRFLEVGAAASAWLPYFHRYYKYQVCGLDYSPEGCLAARKNLDSLGICGEIHQMDFLSDKIGGVGTFDVIFSYGFIEHFENPGLILEKMFTLLNDQGYLIAVVPNLHGLWGSISRTIHKEIHAIHQEMKKEDFEKFFQNKNVDILYGDYFGTYYAHVIGWGARRGRQGALFSLFEKLFCRFFVLIGKMVEILKIEKESVLFSPYIVFIVRKSPQSQCTAR